MRAGAGGEGARGTAKVREREMNATVVGKTATCAIIGASAYGLDDGRCRANDKAGDEMTIQDAGKAVDQVEVRSVLSSSTCSASTFIPHRTRPSEELVSNSWECVLEGYT